MMHEAVPIVFIVIGLPVICVTLIILYKMRQKHERQKGASSTEDELETIEALYQGLKDLNRRIENLEILISDKQGNKQDRRET